MLQIQYYKRFVFCQSGGNVLHSSLELIERQIQKPYVGINSRQDVTEQRNAQFRNLKKRRKRQKNYGVKY